MPPPARTTWGTNWSAQVFYAKNIAGGSNTVTVTFASAVNSFGTIYIHEYAGIDKASPLDVSKSAIGTGRAMSSGSVTTTNASDLLFGAGASRNTVTKAGSGWTTRSAASGNRTEDRNVTTTGSYAATATQNGSAWVMQLVAFKADHGETTPPTVAITSPANNAQVSGIINVTADASDNAGVAGVQFLVDGVNSGPEDGRTLRPRVGHAGGRQRRPPQGQGARPRRNTTLSRQSRSTWPTQPLPERDPRHRVRPAHEHRVPADGRMLVVELREDQGPARGIPPQTRRRSCSSPPPGLALQRAIRHRPDPDFGSNHFYVFYRRGPELRPAVAVHRERDQHRDRRRGEACCIRTRRTPTPSITAAP
jgi:hypothetical protein